MPTPVTHSQSASTWLYQNLDGSSLLLTGANEKVNVGDVSFGVFAGYGADFKSNGKFYGDVTVSHQYHKNVNQNLRFRNAVNKNCATTEIRYSPATVDVPLGKDFYGYVNPNGRAKYDYKNNKWDLSADIFGGVYYKKGKWTFDIEAEKYNLQNKFNIKDVGVNAGVIYNF